jgi:hypothetical protein
MMMMSPLVGELSLEALVVPIQDSAPTPHLAPRQVRLAIHSGQGRAGIVTVSVGLAERVAIAGRRHLRTPVPGRRLCYPPIGDICWFR